MKKIFKKSLAAVLVAALVFVTALPAQVKAAQEFSYDKKVTAYLASKKGEISNSVTIHVSGHKDSERVKSVASSDKKVAEFSSVQYSADTNERLQNGSDKYVKEDWNGVYSYIYMNPLKAGKTTVSYKIGSKSYKTDLTVLAYENPVASLKISGVNNDKDLSSLTNSQKNAQTKITKTVNNAKINVKAKDGWKISRISISGNDYYYYISDYKQRSANASFSIGKIEKGKRYYAYITFVNTKTGGEIECYYDMPEA